MQAATGIPVVDVNTFFGKRVDSDPRYSAAALCAELDRHRVALALSYAQRGVDYHPAGGNDETLALARANPRILPVATVNPRDSLGWRGEIDRCLQAGVRVFRLFPGAQAWPVDSQAFRSLVRHLRGKSAWLILSAIDVGDWSALAKAAAAADAAEVPLLFVETHYSNMAEVLAVMQQYPRVYSDTSMLATVGAVDLMVREAGVAHLLFGSGAPWHSLQKALNQVLEADIGEADKAAILGGNALKLFGLDAGRCAGAPRLEKLEPQAFAEPSIDVHSHLGYWALPHPQEHYDPGPMLRRMARFNIARSVVSSYESMRYDIAAGNRAVADAIAGHPELCGYVELDPHHLELSCAEMDRYYRLPNFVGCEVELTHIPCPTGSPQVRALIAEVARRGKPILFMAHGAQDAPAERELARANPGLTLIHAHGFDADWARGVQDTPNICVEYSYSRATHHRIREGLDILGPERVLVGTDQTLLSVGAEIGMYWDARMTAAERRLVLQENARRIFKLQA